MSVIEFGLGVKMADKSPQFEHYAREATRAMSEFICKPEDIELQLELFGVLQVTGLLYRRVIREFGASYGKSMDELRKTAREAVKYVPKTKRTDSLLKDIRYDLVSISKEPIVNEKGRLRSRLDRLVG